MERTFEDAIMDTQGKIISLCLEVIDIVGVKVEAIGAFCYNEIGVRSFDAFFVQDNQTKTKIEVGIGGDLAKEFLTVGIEYVDEIDAICKEYGRPTPIEMHLWYETETSRFNAEYKYDPILNRKKPVHNSVFFRKWQETVQKELDVKKKRPSMNMGGSVVSRNILENKGRLKWCVREKSVNPNDNGWRFFSDVDTDEYLQNPANMAICDWGTVFEIEPAIMPIFDMPVGTELALEIENGRRFFVYCDTGEECVF